MNEELAEILHREELVLADIKKRALAFTIDEFLLSFIFIFAIGDSFSKAENIEALIALINNFTLEYMIIRIMYQSFFVMQYGATIGKLAMKIRIIEIRTVANPNILVSLNRAIFRIISELLFYLGFLWGILNPNRQTWHDLTAKTLVVNA